MNKERRAHGWVEPALRPDFPLDNVSFLKGDPPDVPAGIYLRVATWALVLAWLALNVLVDAIKVGPYVLNDVKAMTCKDCVSLLGVSALSRFDMQSSKVRGAEFLSLTPRR